MKKNYDPPPLEENLWAKTLHTENQIVLRYDRIGKDLRLRNSEGMKRRERRRVGGGVEFVKTKGKERGVHYNVILYSGSYGTGGGTCIPNCLTGLAPHTYPIPTTLQRKLSHTQTKHTNYPSIHTKCIVLVLVINSGTLTDISCLITENTNTLHALR